MTLQSLRDPSLRFILFGGKGGVGKTTMAAATAIELARKHRTLIFTTDPSPSLADSFGQPIGSSPTPIAGLDGLFAMEINARKVLQEFKEEFGNEIVEILQQGTYLDDAEAEELFQLDIPGLDEVMGFKKILDFIENADYQTYLVDTAPTGHTLRLLMLPELLEKWIHFLAALRWKYHLVSRRLTHHKRTTGADTFLLTMKQTVNRVKALLQNARQTEFVVITIAEKMAVCETEDLVKNLKHMKIPSRNMVINHLFPPEECEFIRLRREHQEQYRQSIKEKFATYIMTEVALQPAEIQGIVELQKLGQRLFSQPAEEELPCFS